jgi:hypothetical protein
MGSPSWLSVGGHELPALAAAGYHVVAPWINAVMAVPLAGDDRFCRRVWQASHMRADWRQTTVALG